MDNKEIRLLRVDEIECRIGTISEKGLSLLLYKDARADMKILDEVYGTTGWQRKHEVIGGNLYCTVSIWDSAKEQWISKQDVGTESYTEKEKGQASDSFKRACVSLGIGRELYTAPFIWVGASKTKIENQNGRWVCRDKFKVTEISYSDIREITGITITNQNGAVVYQLREAAHKSGSAAKPKSSADNISDADKEQAVNRELVRTGVALDAVLQRYGVMSIGEMTDETYRKAMNGLKRTKSKAA